MIASRVLTNLWGMQNCGFHGGLRSRCLAALLASRRSSPMENDYTINKVAEAGVKHVHANAGQQDTIYYFMGQHGVLE